jgi:hypothetical protein
MPDDSTDTLVLYVVNLLQPVEISRLDKELVRYSSLSPKIKSHTPFDLQATMKRLVTRKLLMITKGRYAVTLKGLESVSHLGLGRIRDKNRLFILKKAL